MRKSLSTSERPRSRFPLVLAGGLFLGLAAWGGGLAASVHLAAQPESTSVTVRPLFTDRTADSAAKSVKAARPSQSDGVLRAPDFVREAWARDAALRNQQQKVASAFETRFVPAQKVAGAITGEQFASLVKASQKAAEAKAAQIAQAEANPIATPAAADAPIPVQMAAVAKSAETKMQQVQNPQQAQAQDSEEEGASTLLASLETDDLPDLGLVPSWRPAIARKSVIAPIVPTKKEEPVQALAYARPDNPIERPASKSASIPWPGLGRKTAVYDVSGAVVYMPNGERLEAHSGRGKMRDNPKYSHVKMRGSTPASTYKLTMREQRFHGVEAIRLNPIDGKAPKNRTGLLAHTYLLRVPGDSSGCVVFKNYPRFLAAFKRGEIDHMVVVDSLDKAPSMSVGARVASLFSRS
ncbi:DUF2778 domain-containing protein [Tianweitania sp. BSSL-BM11]|uniref:DUF2778 domain-containing protein n=1 Tax=Tianweitania aestuarii TaxID=2814886 RepID=A0ABS5RYW0_9HYPH|nr:DUF2778 domain-containing protein [Tianweitania aestuarii]MBS9722226.1 DUF2778 domain-containing protein [Tianweitania aestuarii]